MKTLKSIFSVYTKQDIYYLACLFISLCYLLYGVISGLILAKAQGVNLMF